MLLSLTGALRYHSPSEGLRCWGSRRKQMSMDMDEEKKNKYSHQPGPWPQGEPALSASHSAYTNNVPVDIELLRPERAGTALAASQEKRRGLFGFTQHLMLRQGDRNNNLQPQTLKSWWRSTHINTSSSRGGTGPCTQCQT